MTRSTHPGTRRRARAAAALGVIAAVLLGLVLGSCGRSQKRPDVVLVSIDTLRADRLGAYGHTAAQTPNLDRLAQEGTLYLACETPAPITLPAHTSMMTGDDPPQHGVRNNLIYALPESTETLAERFRDAGYVTGAFISAAPVESQYGLGQGFDHFDEEGLKGHEKLQFAERPGTQTVAAALRWVRSQKHAKPLFVWVHLFEPHAPYDPPEPFRRLLRDPYDGEVAAADAEVGNLLDGLRQERGHDPLVAVVGDHGEGLGQHGERSHAFYLYESTTHVPWILHGPGIAPGKRIETRVSLVDVAPTLLDLAGLDADLGEDGEVTYPDAKARPLYAETLYTLEAFGWSPMFARWEGTRKVVHSARPQVFDLARDPQERHDLADQPPDWAGGMLEAVQEDLRRMGSTSSVGPAPTEEQQRALASLGYVSGGSAASTDVDELLATTGTHVDGVGRHQELALQQAAEDSLRTKNFAAAIEKLQRVVADNPNNGWAWSLLSDAYQKTQQWPDAIASLEHCLRLQPLRSAHRLTLAQLYEKAGRPDDALREYQECMRNAPYDRNLVRGAALGMAQLKRPDAATAELEKILAANVVSPELQSDYHATCAILYAQQRRLDLARKHVEAARAGGDTPQLQELAKRLGL